MSPFGDLICVGDPGPFKYFLINKWSFNIYALLLLSELHTNFVSSLLRTYLFFCIKTATCICSAFHSTFWFFDLFIFDNTLGVSFIDMISGICKQKKLNHIFTLQQTNKIHIHSILSFYAKNPEIIYQYD